MDFIFMLTRNDRTIDDALDVVDLIRPAGLKHVGFKDVGATPEILGRLVHAIHGAGALAYVEMVATDPQACLASAKLARDIGVDRLLGGTQAMEVLAILKGSRTEYLPFPASRSATRRSSAGQRQTWRRIAAPSRSRVAPVAIFSPTARQRPIRSIWCAPRAGGSVPASSWWWREQ